MKRANDAAEFEIVTDPARLNALEAEWNDLCRRSRDRRFTQSFAWRKLGWQTTGEPRGRRLSVLVMRERGAAVLIWPLALRRRMIFWREACPAGPEFTDYDALLVEDGPHAGDLIRRAWAFLRRQDLADVVTASNVRHGSAMHAVLDGDAAPRASETLPAPYISWRGFESWDAYWGARSKNMRLQAGRRMRRLAELGEVTFALVDNAADYREGLAWTLREKSAWMARAGVDNDFMRTPEFHDFLSAVGAARASHGRWVMFVMKLDGRIVATKLGALDGRRFEGFIAAQDPGLAAYSVGSIILNKTLQWLFDRRIEYDFRIGDEAYKRDWATGDCPATTYRVAAGRWGAAWLVLSGWLLSARRAKDGFRARISARTRRRLKAWATAPLTLLRGARSVGAARAGAPAQ